VNTSSECQGTIRCGRFWQWWTGAREHRRGAL